MGIVSDRARENFQRTENDIDELLHSISRRWHQRENKHDRNRKGKTPPQAKLRAKCNDENLGKAKLQKWQMHLEEVCGDSSKKATLMQKAPLTETKDGNVRVDVNKLRRSPSCKMRGIGDRRPLTSEDIEVAYNLRTGKTQRSASAPNFLQKNASASSLKCLRPETRQREQAKQTQRRAQKSTQAKNHREVEALWASTNIQEYLRFRSESSAIDQLRRYASEGRCSIASEVVESGVVRKRGSLLNRHSAIAVETKELFRWLAADAFLGSVLLLKRRARAQALWAYGIQFVRLIRMLSRWRRKARGRHLVRKIMALISPSFRLLVRHRKKKFASQRIQREWRSFSFRMRLYVEALVDRHWRKHEVALLEEMFTECPADGEVVIGHHHGSEADKALLNLRDEENALYSLTRSASSSQPRVSFCPEDLGLSKRLQSGDLKGAGAILKSAISGSVRASVVASTSPFTANSDSSGTGSRASLVGVPLWSKLRKTVERNREPTGIDALVINMTKQGRGKLQGHMFSQVLDEAVKRRRQSQVYSHCFRKQIARMILRREIVERLYDKIRQTRGIRSRISIVCDALDLSTSPVPITLQPSSEEIAEIVLCAHYGHGARPARAETAFTYFKRCPCWRILAISGLLEGTRSIQDNLMERWAVRRGHLKETVRHFKKFTSRAHDANLSFFEFADELQKSKPVEPRQRSRPASAPAASSAFRSAGTRPNYSSMDDTLDSDDFQQTKLRRSLTDMEFVYIDDAESIGSEDGNTLPSQESGLRSLLPPPGFNSTECDGLGTVDVQNDFKPPWMLQKSEKRHSSTTVLKQGRSDKWRP